MSSREFYNETAHVYGIRHGSPTTRVLRKLESELIGRHAHGKVLDAGCGTGFWIGRADAGFDVSETMLKAAMIGDSPLAQASVEDMPFGDDSFDTVLCLFSVLNLCDPQKVFQELGRVCKTGGKAILSFASIWDHEHKSIWGKIRTDRKFVPNLRKKTFRVRKKEVTLRLFDREDIAKLAEDHCFRLVEFDSVYRLVKPRWNNFEDFNPIEKFLLGMERLLPLKDYGCMYLIVMEKTSSS